MTQREDILAHLKKSRNTAVERVLDQAMQFESAPTDSGEAAPPPPAAELAAVLLERNRRPGWVAMIRHFDRIGEAMQRELIERPRDLFAPLSETIDETSGEARANVIRIVQHTADAKLVYLLAEALMDARGEVRELAGQTLLDAIRRYRQHGFLAPSAPPGEQESLRRAVDFALNHFKTHRQQSALHAALVFERRQEGGVWAFIGDHFADITRAGNILLRQPNDPLLADATLLALGSSLKAAAAHGLSVADGQEFGRNLARASFRLLDPTLGIHAAEMATHCKALAAPKREVPWDDQSWPDWLRLIELLGLPTPLKLAWLTRMLEGASATPAQKVLTLRAVDALNQPEGLQILANYVSDPDERVARVAARSLLTRRKSEVQIYASAFAGSSHVSVRQMATLAIGPTKFDKHWKDYTRLPPAIQVNNTRTLAVNDSNFPQQLRGKLINPNPEEIVQGLRLLQTLPEIKPYRNDIIRLSAHGDARVAASAVRLIGRLDDQALLDLLEAAAQHADPRVRANAVESMETLKVADRSKQVLAMLNSRFNRERANAIKAISTFDFRTGRQTLARMLVDPNPMHRVSALWVVDHMAILDIVRQVATLARRDTNPHVRTRAAELLERLTGPVRSPS